MQYMAGSLFCSALRGAGQSTRRGRTQASMPLARSCKCLLSIPLAADLPKMTAAVHVAVGDCIGALVAIAGVAVAFFFPR